MKFIDFFAGIGGFRLGMEQAGHECVGFVEIDKFAVKSYMAMYNTEGEYYANDITRIDPKDLPEANGYTFGFPCQSFSIAGKRGGINDTRGTLFFEVMRLAKVRQPKYLFAENVTGLLSDDGGRTFGTILRTLWECGYDAQWQVLNSKAYVPQNRERIFIIGHLRGECRPKVFPIAVSCGQAVSAQRKINVIGNISYRENGTQDENKNIYSHKGIMGSLKATDYKSPKKIAIPIITPDREKKRQNGRRFKTDGEEMFTLTAQDRHGVIVFDDTQCFDGVREYDCFSPALRANRNGLKVGIKEAAKCRKVKDEKGDGMRIRKLTPLECFRLQGFPDELFYKAQAVNSDSQLYKQAGNAVTVPVIYEIAKRLKR